jgi:hypothetical protein
MPLSVNSSNAVKKLKSPIIIVFKPMLPCYLCNYRVKTIATSRGVYIRRYLERTYGKGRWRKLKGIATVQLSDGTICESEIH